MSMKPATKRAMKSSRRKSEVPMEFARGWQELEQQHDRLKMDWGSLAAQLGISDSSTSEEF